MKGNASGLLQQSLPTRLATDRVAATLLLMRACSFALLLSLVATACGGTVTTATSAVSQTTMETGASTTIPEAESPCLRGSSNFFGDGPLGSQSRDTADAATLTALELTEFEGCEQLVINLAALSEAPATSLGMTSAEFLRSNGVVRVHLDPLITGTAVSDVVLNGSLVDRAYVVRDLDQSLFVDVHLGAPTLARFSEISDPARLVVDFVPGGSDVGSPERSDFVVAMPLNATVSTPVTVDGYGRTFEASVILRARSNGEIVAEDFTTSADYVETWGRFQIDLPPGVTGNLELFIGEDSARDGEEQGIRFYVTVEG